MWNKILIIYYIINSLFVLSRFWAKPPKKRDIKNENDLNDHDLNDHFCNKKASNMYVIR